MVNKEKGARMGYNCVGGRERERGREEGRRGEWVE